MPLLRGNLSFKGFGQEASKNVPYLIISSTNQERRQPKNDGAGDGNDAGGGNSSDSDHDDIMTSACRAWKHMRKDLKLSQPKLMISVTGGAKRFEMKKRHLKSFKRGLMKAATTSNAWIITGGTKNGVMEFVGDAVKEFMLENGAYEQGLVVLGIATLGAVSHCEDLIRQCSEQNATPVTPYAYSPPNQPQGKKALLDPHHTHFILVDDGTRDSFGKEIAFRAAYEQHNHELTTAVNSDCDICGVPVVMLVLEGGINTLQTACEAIEKNTPVIVMQGSGRAADFVVRAQSFIESGDEEGLRLESLTLVSESDIDKAVRFTKTLLHPSRRHLMTVFQHNEDTSGDELAEAILKALLRASLNSSRLTKQATSDFLALALSFNRCDIAKKEILNLEKKSELFNPSILNDPFMTALTENKFDFVQFFLDLGVELKSFFDYGKLNLIYRHALLNASSGSSVEVMKCIIYDVTNGKLPESILPAVRRTVNSLTEDQFVDLYKGVRMDELLENPERELFFWCILLNYQEMARIFWRAGIDYIGGALTASRIMSSLSLVALKRMEEFELSRQLNEEASKYEDEAKCILNECYDCNPELAKNLMVRNLSTWGNRTLFDLANDARLMDFSEHDCCQAKLNYIWYGRMKSHTSPWMVILGLFLPLVVVRFIEFRDADDSNHVVPLDDEESFSSTTSSASSSSSSSKFEFLRKRSSNISLLKMRTRSSRCCGRFFGNLCSFFAAPFVKFGYYTISYLVLLSIFSYFVMIELQPVQVSILEIVTWIWMIIRCLDEFRQLLMCDAPTLRLKFSRYFSDPWNIYDLVINTFIVLAIILRFELDGERFGAVRILYSLTLLLCILRLLKLFYIHQYVGPKVIMIQKVMFDLMFFVLIFGVFLFSYGVAAQSLLYPNSEPTWHVLMKIVYQPYFTLFGQFNLEELLGKVPNCVTNQTLYQSDPFNYPLCSQYSWMALLLFSVYAIMVCTMLVNLLVAIFSFTFTSIQETALKTWQFHRIATIREFSEKPTLAPPFIIISHIFMIIGLICSCRKKRQPIRNEFRMEYEDIQNRRLGALERKGMENHLINKKVQLKTDNNFMVKSTSEKTEVIVGHLENIREFLNKKSMRRSKINSNNTAMEKAQKVKSQEKQKKFEILNERMNRFEDELEKQTTKLDAIVKLLQDKMMQ